MFKVQREAKLALRAWVWFLFYETKWQITLNCSRVIQQLLKNRYSRPQRSDFCSQSKIRPNPTQHDPHGPDDPLGTINYHHLDISGHDGMDEQDIGWRNGWADEDFGSEVKQMWLIFVQS